MLENKIICGPALEVLETLPTKSVNCSISSPPYWALRDYSACNCRETYKGGPHSGYTIHEGHLSPRPKEPDPNCPKCNGTGFDKETKDKQLGLEKTFEEFIDKLCTTYDEVKRVLTDDGCCFINLGDTYSAESTHASKSGATYYDGISKDYGKKSGRTVRSEHKRFNSKHIPQKSLCLIPQRFAIEMVNRGWILRNTIIWAKLNPMPSSAKDRFTVSHEYCYFFVKSNKTLSWIRPDGKMVSKQPDFKNGKIGLDFRWGERQGKPAKLSCWKGYCYFFEPIYEPYNYDGRHDTTLKPTDKYGQRNIGQPQKMEREPMERWPNPLGRNKRTVWTIPTQSFSEAHFATFPEKLVEPMILSGCPKEVCSVCGKGRRKVYETEILSSRYDRGYKSSNFGIKQDVVANHHFKGYTDCGCGAEFRPGLVMDIFMGSGTVGKVAAQNGRNWLGIELKQEYIEMAKRRINEGETGISVREQKQGQMGLYE